ncbi:winged helix DNA-binding domain-containing protein [Phytohabitans kaempferiae]|uniref:Winged helix DNA-binding domain-containing protein n=1 Tax=Phytohabitans kaempferiae TaxID=1620943 RepID=A0ABV6MDV9_9ACTN
MANTREIALLRLAAQRLAGPGHASAAEAVRWLTAAQAQDHGGAVTSVALRTTGGTRAEVEAAFAAAEVVKSWPLRGTLHLVAAEDLPWILALAAPRVIARSAARHTELALDEKTIGYAHELTREALAGGRSARRDELIAGWEKAGVGTSGQRGYHILRHLAMTGVLCFGPLSGGEQLLVLVDEWVPHPRRPEREEALGELALRYFRGHGPATVKDYTRWAGLTAAEVKAGIAAARPRLEAIEADGVAHLMDPTTPELLAANRKEAREVLLLPGFDEYMLGYADRTAALPAAYASRIVPGGNGVFQPTVVSGGQVVGTWRAVGRAGRRAVEATPFAAFGRAAEAAIPKRYAEGPYAR